MQAQAQVEQHAQKQEVVLASENETLLSKKASSIVKQAQDLAVQDEQQLSEAVDFLGNVKAYAKDVDKERRFLVDPLNAHVKTINARFKPITDGLGKAEQVAKGKVLAYQQEQQRKAREEAARRQKEADDAALAAAQAAEKNGDTIGAEAAVDRASRTTYREVAVAPAVGGTTGASASTQKRLACRITDVAALAKAFPDVVEVKQNKVLSLHRAGIKDVPGVEFYHEETVVVR